MKLHDLFEHVDDFMESVTYRAPDSDWYVAGSAIERKLVIPVADTTTEVIYVKLEPSTFTFNNRTIDYINLSFEGTDEQGRRTTQLTGKFEQASKPIGAVFNAYMEKLTEYEYSALSFIAVDDVERRMRIYARIVTRNLERFGSTYQPDIKLNGGGKALVVFKRSNEPWANEFIAWLRSQNKT